LVCQSLNDALISKGLRLSYPIRSINTAIV